MKKVREKEEIMKENVIKFIKNNWRWMILFICLIGFLALAEEVFHQEIMNGDIVGYDIVSKLFKFNVSTPIAKFITNFGGAIFVISLTTILFFVIKDKKIDPYKNVRLIINIDEQSTKSNGYYNLKDGLTEELLHGIINYNYDITHKNILFGKLDISLSYQDSGKSYLVQAADLIAGTTRRKALADRDDIDIIDHKLLFP